MMAKKDQANSKNPQSAQSKSADPKDASQPEKEKESSHMWGIIILVVLIVICCIVGFCCYGKKWEEMYLTQNNKNWLKSRIICQI